MGKGAQETITRMKTATRMYPDELSNALFVFFSVLSRRRLANHFAEVFSYQSIVLKERRISV
jgi:hypothetical protein